MSEQKKRKVIRAGREAIERDAGGLKGVLVWDPIDQAFYFQIPDEKEEDGFRIYRLLHDDLLITIEKESLASLYDYDGEDEGELDHSPEVMDYEIIE